MCEHPIPVPRPVPTAHHRSKRVRPKTYVFAFYMTVGIALIPLAAIGSVFWLRHRVQIDTHSPALLRKQAEIQASAPAPAAAVPVPSPAAEPVQPSLKPSLGPARLTVPVDPVQQVFDLDQQAYGYMQQGEYDLARVTLLQAENINPKDARTLGYQGELAEAERDWPRAVSYWQRVADLGPAAGTLASSAPQRLQAAKARASAAAAAPGPASAAPAPSSPAAKPASVPVPAAAKAVPAPAAAPVAAPGLKVGPIEKTAAGNADFVLRIPILNPGGGAVDPGKVGIKLFFYDDAKGGPVPTNARLDVSFEALRPSWTGGRTEVLRAYYQKTAGPGARFYGYLFRLYYGNVLVEERADPPSLLQLYPAQSP